MKKHTDACAAKEGITYSFQNGEIILLQDNFKNLGECSINCVFDFETTTGDTVIFNPKMFCDQLLSNLHISL